MKIRSIIAVLLTGTLVSCNNFLDVKPKGMVIPQTVEDYNLILNLSRGSNGNVTYMSPEVYMPQVVLPSAGASQIAAYRWDEYQFLENQTDGGWDGLYARIYACNEIIENIDDASTTTLNETLRKNVKGQALAERARCYFVLVNVYAKHYSSQTIGDLGVPLLLTNDIQQKSKRATIGKVYESVLADLNQAKDLVPETVKPSEKVKATKQGVYAFLAKVHLFRNEIDLAYNAITEAFKTPVTLLDYKQYVKTEITDKYNRSSLPTDVQNIPEVIWHATTPSNFWGTTAYLSDWCVNMFDQDQDLRFYFFACNTERRSDKLLPEGAYRYCNRISRTHAASSAEMYLLRAECYARKGEYTLAINDLNTLREKRYKDNTAYQLSAANKQEAITHVKNERVRELACTGQYWFDLKRYQAYGESVAKYTRTPDKNSVVNLEPGSNRYVCSIPRFVIGKNSNIVQNPR